MRRPFFVKYLILWYNAALAIAADIHIVLALVQARSKQYDMSGKRGPTEGGKRPNDET